MVISTAKAETADIFYNAQNTQLLRRIINSIGHPQLTTPIKTDIDTANGFIPNNMHLRKNETWDIHYY